LGRKESFEKFLPGVPASADLPRRASTIRAVGHDGQHCEVAALLTKGAWDFRKGELWGGLHQLILQEGRAPLELFARRESLERSLNA